MSAIGAPITSDMFHATILKKIAKVGTLVDDPFKGIYQDVKAKSLTVNLPFSLNVGGLVETGLTSGKSIYGNAPRGNVSWGNFVINVNRWARDFDVNSYIAQSDQAGVYADLPEKITFAVQSHWPSVMTDMLVGGFSGGSTPVSEIDGLSFFNASHRLIGKTTYSNTSTNALSEYSYTLAKQTLNSYFVQPDEHSRPQLLNPTSKRVLMVGPGQEILAKKIVKRDKGALGETNVLEGDAEIVVNRFLTGSYANYWFLFAVGGESKSIAKWEYEPTKLQFFSEKNSMECASSAIWRYVASLVGNAHLMFPYTVYGSTGATAYTPGTGVIYGTDAVQMKSLS